MDRFYLEKALSNAKKLRGNQTDCENIIWQHLRGKRLENIKFRRQVPIGKYIVDFVNLEKKLIVELDSSQHLDKANKIYDDERTKFLQKYGYAVLRFNDNDVLTNLEAVLQEITNKYKNL